MCMDRWKLYEMLKGNGIPETISEIENLVYLIDNKELREGVIEYLIMKQMSQNDELMTDRKLTTEALFEILKRHAGLKEAKNE